MLLKLSHILGCIGKLLSAVLSAYVLSPYCGMTLGELNDVCFYKIMIWRLCTTMHGLERWKEYRVQEFFNCLRINAARNPTITFHVELETVASVEDTIRPQLTFSTAQCNLKSRKFGILNTVTTTMPKKEIWTQNRSLFTNANNHLNIE